MLEGSTLLFLRKNVLDLVVCNVRYAGCGVDHRGVRALQAAGNRIDPEPGNIIRRRRVEGVGQNQQAESRQDCNARAVKDHGSPSTEPL